MCRTPLAAVFVTMFALMFQVSCVGQAPLTQEPDSLTLKAALAGIDSLPSPEGVDTAGFDSLRAAARQELLATGQERWLAGAPQGQLNVVADLALTRLDDFTAQAQWSYRNVGDYDQNSEANIADLTPLGAKLGRTSADPDWSTAQLSDGDGNGEVNIADITPLGANLLSRVDGYFVQSTTTPLVEASWTTVGMAQFSDSTQSSPGVRRRFSVAVPAVAGESFRVVPFSGPASGVPGLPFTYTGQSGGSGLSFEEHSAVLDAITEKIGNLNTETSAEQDQELADFIGGLPNVEASGSFEGNAWGRFSDGRCFIVCKNREPDMAGAQASSLELRDTSTVGVPASELADFFNSFGTGTVYHSPVEDLKGIFEDKGYTPFADPAYVSYLKVVKNSGVFYIDAHGGTAVQRDDAHQYAIWTDEPYTAENEVALGDDLDANRLLYMFAKDAAGNEVWKYAFSDEFVSEYMTFSANSVVFINACNSGTATDMIDAFHTAGATVYLGWTVSVRDSDANEAAAHFFDRVLGANVLSRTENPPIRPFNYLDTLTDMYTRGVSIFYPVKYPPMVPKNQVFTKLIFSTDDGDETSGFWLLSPTISNMQMSDQSGELFLQGDFGDHEGVVTVGGEEVTVTQWDPVTLVCEIPDSGPGSSGDVIVYVRGHPSNVRQLTDWRGTFDFKAQGQGSLERSVSFDIHFRADIGDWRMFPATDPLLKGAFGFGPTPINCANDSYGTVHSTGSYTDGGNNTTTWNDGTLTQLPPHDPMNPQSNLILCTGVLDLVDMDLLLELQAFGDYKEKLVDSGGTTLHDTYFGFIDDMDEYFGTGQGLLLTLNPDFSFAGDNLQKVDGDFTYSLSWGPITVDTPPNPNSAR
ncbi:MAG: hypothetical protein H7A35_06545 [Planctomycetales bacterium]|nr:hypothetical protein [bacterium]UNM09716.1 MAG: hypothetical protein H7A35_06545 [Planctomycetales bacterium]